jgi:hypothetical protein
MANLVGWNGEDAVPDLDLLKQGIASFVKPVLDIPAESPSLRYQVAWNPLHGSEPRERGVTPRVFICYRRSDAIDAAARLYDALAAPYGRQAVFMDVVGQVDPHAAEQVDLALSECGAVLVVIGPKWLDVTDRDGNRKLDSPTDHVRVEIAAALRQQIPLIPLLVQGGNFPAPDDLPQDIRSIAYRNGFDLRVQFWDAGVAELIAVLDRVMKH